MLLDHPLTSNSYQTPQGIIQGIQWVPAEATQILPAGATPANAVNPSSRLTFLLTDVICRSSLPRGTVATSRERTRGLSKNGICLLKRIGNHLTLSRQKSEEKRRKKEEKDSIKRLSKQFDKDMQEVELRAARDREIQTRERRRSFYGDAPPPGYGPGSTAYGAFTHSPSAELDRKFTELEIERDVKFTTRQRKYSTSGGDRNSVYGPPSSSAYSSSSPVPAYQNPGGYAGSGTYNRAASPYRQPSVYSTSPNPRPQEISSYPGGPDPIARAASPYGRPEPIARAASPYGRPEPIARAASPYGRPPVEPIARASSPYGRLPVEPIARAASPYGQSQPSYSARAPSPYGQSQPSYSARAPSPIPPSRGPPPQRSTSPFPRAPSPYAHMNSSVYPPGHVLEGQSFSRSRAPSPMPGPPGVAFPTSPRMPSAVVGGEVQLTAPEAFSRPANAAQSYTPFNTMKIQDMEQFYDQIPRMPLVLETHDVYHQDWIRFMNVRLSLHALYATPVLKRRPPSPGSRARMGWKDASSRVFPWTAA